MSPSPNIGGTCPPCPIGIDAPVHPTHLELKEPIMHYEICTNVLNDPAGDAFSPGCLDCEDVCCPWVPFSFTSASISMSSSAAYGTVGGLTRYVLATVREVRYTMSRVDNYSARWYSCIIACFQCSGGARPGSACATDQKCSPRDQGLRLGASRGQEN